MSFAASVKAGSVSQAAEMCDLSRAAFQRILRQLDIDRSRFAEG
jgi:DNA-binding transcriptional LysR family regulator